MRTEVPARPFPYTCHAAYRTGRPVHAYFGAWVCFAFLLLQFLLLRSVPVDQPAERVFHSLGLVFGLCGLAFLPIRLGWRSMLPNRVVTLCRATWVLPRLGSPELLLGMCAGATMAGGGILFDDVFVRPGSDAKPGEEQLWAGGLPLMIGAAIIAYCVWQMLRGMKLTPESLTYWRGFGRITLAWDEIGDVQSTNDVRDHEGYRKFLHRYQPGAKVVVPPERVSVVLLRVRWEDHYTPRLLLETEHFTVEPSALLTAILAIRDRPELRPMLGTRESKVLFVGPPWRVRRHLYRTQQWWPKGAAPEGVAVDRDGVVVEAQ